MLRRKKIQHKTRRGKKEVGFTVSVKKKGEIQIRVC